MTDPAPHHSEFTKAIYRFRWPAALFMLVFCAMWVVTMAQMSDVAAVIPVPIALAAMNLGFSWEARKATAYLQQAVGGG